MDEMLATMMRLCLNENLFMQGTILTDSYRELFFNLPTSAPFQQSFSKLTKDSERVHLIYRLKSFRTLSSFLTENSSTDPKDVIQASKFRTDGNRAFVANRTAEALSLYNEAIRYAPEVDNDPKNLEELPLAYGNRSATFFQLGQYEDSLKDIEAALAFGYDRYKPITKLVFRKCECLLKLGRFMEAKEVLDVLKPENITNSDRILWEKLYQLAGENVDSLQSENNSIKSVNRSLNDLDLVIRILTEKGRFQSQSKLSSLSSKVAVHYDFKNGHHLVTTEDIRFGDILAVTKPYASSLTKKQERKFCHHCLVPLESQLRSFSDRSQSNVFIPRSVPCGKCVRVLYCSENCRSESWNVYHRFECSLKLKIFDSAVHSRLALRTVLTAGGLDSIRNVIQKYEYITEETSSSFELRDPVDYEHVFLKKVHQTLCPKLNTKMLIKLTINACFMAKFALMGGFLKDFDSKKSQEKVQKEEEFLAAEILRHSIQIFTNHSSFTKSNLIGFADVDKIDSKSNDFQLDQFETLDPLIRMVKYSCDPNISILSVDGDGNKSNISVFFASRPIPAGSTLTAVLSAYGSWVRVRLYPFQLAYSQKRKYFQELGLPCPCPKCLVEQQDNPFGSNGIEYYPIACADCHGLFTRKVPSGPFKCSKCNRQASVSEMKKAYKTIKVLEAQANLLIESIVNDLRRYVDYYQSMIKLELLVTQKICPLLYGGAYLFASLFERLSSFYRDYALDNPDNFALCFRKAWMYTEKALCTFEQYDYGNECVSVFVLLNVMIEMFGDTLDDENFEERFSKSGMADNGQDLLERFRVIKQRALKMKELYKFI